MEEVQKNTGNSLGIAALITAIITFVLAVIPCVGLIAIIPGIIAVILASVGLSQASRSNAPRGILVAGLIIAVLASLISVSQVYVAGKLVQNSGSWPNEIGNIINDVQDNVIKDLEDANVSIKIEADGDKVEINTSSDKKEREQTLEDLEGVNTQKNDSVKTKK